MWWEILNFFGKATSKKPSEADKKVKPKPNKHDNAEQQESGGRKYIDNKFKDMKTTCFRR